ncbi:hypothetical protein GCM10009837_39980 [Streptomyces durmitorensis]|uniref:Uncharacterized protein n=1 Tax=Streptomyces durmitorensis TaxID=319947 RepID=A0ABY4Q726_9ACTN|nr:hypothetical protein [Streptomyces durmitorensis]UQT60951.1 hypothetical protein M4V62_41030 [Streptomyces durmitorensis]
MTIKKRVTRATAVALLAAGGLAVGTGVAPAGDSSGAPGGGLAPMADDYRQGLTSPATACYQGKAPWSALDWEGADKAAPWTKTMARPAVAWRLPRATGT